MNNYSTVESIQERLAQVGIQSTVDHILRAKTIKPREEILRALTVVDSNAQAKAYLQRLMTAAAAPATQGNSAPNAPAQSQSLPPPHRPVPQAPPAGNTQLLPASPVQSAFQAPGAIRQGAPSGPAPTLRQPGAAPTLVPKAPENKAEGFHIYGGKAALTVEPGENRNGKPVVFIDAAPAIGERQYDWEQKIRLMLTPAEVVTALAVTLGYLPSCEFKNHGEDSDKWFVIENQKKNLFIKIGQGKTLRAVPVAAFDAFRFGAILSAQARKQLPQLAAADVQTLVRLIVAPMLLAQKSAA